MKYASAKIFQLFFQNFFQFCEISSEKTENGNTECNNKKLD